jgi:glyoxylase I family protein
VPNLNGRTAIVMTVVDVALSADWYESVLSFTRTHTNYNEIVLTHRTGLVLSLVSHSGGRIEKFDERRVGLDHLEFLVDNRRDLDGWVAHFNQLGVSHSGIKEPHYSRAAILTFRDPDNIQLELYWPNTT